MSDAGNIFSSEELSFDTAQTSIQTAIIQNELMIALR